MKLKNNVVIFNYLNNKNNKTNSISSFKMGININTKHDIVTEKNEIIKEEKKICKLYFHKRRIKFFII